MTENSEQRVADPSQIHQDTVFTYFFQTRMSLFSCPARLRGFYNYYLLSILNRIFASPSKARVSRMQFFQIFSPFFFFFFFFSLMAMDSCWAPVCHSASIILAKHLNLNYCFISLSVLVLIGLFINLVVVYYFCCYYYYYYYYYSYFF